MKNISIPITDDGDQCNSSYLVEIKLSGDAGYSIVPGIFTESPIVINNLQDGAVYDVRITRNCCDGQISPPEEIQIATSLLAPENFTATPYTGPEISLAWDEVGGATNYIIDRALDAGFTSSLTERYNGAYTSSFLDTVGLLGATTYYYRIKAQASGLADSAYSYANATTP